MDSTLLMVFFLMLFFSMFIGWLITGAFTAYFGANKSKTIGVLLILLGVVCLLLFYVIGYMPMEAPFGVIEGSVGAHSAVATDAVASAFGFFFGGLLSLFFLLGLILMHEKKAAKEYVYEDETEKEEEGDE